MLTCQLTQDHFRWHWWPNAPDIGEKYLLLEINFVTNDDADVNALGINVDIPLQLH